VYYIQPLLGAVRTGLLIVLVLYLLGVLLDLARIDLKSMGRRPLLAFEVIITKERSGNFASEDTHFLENWSCSGLRSRLGFIVAGALRGLLRAVT